MKSEPRTKPSETDQYLVLGNPISHSRSPQIHLAFARQTQQSMVYGLQLVELDRFAATLDQLRQNPCFRGCNVTVPFKLEALAYVQQHQAQQHQAQISTRALLGGAVNTLKFEGDAVFADNTDGVGLVNDIIQRQAISLQEAKVLLLGAGGAARGVILPLLDAGVSCIVVANRSVDKAQILIDSVRRHAPQYRDKLVVSSLAKALNHAPDVLINATSTSLSEDSGGSRLGLPELLSAEMSFEQSVGDQTIVKKMLVKKKLAKIKLAYDMVYGEKPSKFLLWAQENGCQNICDGLGMLVEQAAESFTLWRGVRPSADPVFNQLRASLMESVQITAAT